MVDTRDLTPGDRRELRSLIKRQFGVLRSDVKRRGDELRAEIEKELLTRYRAQDEAIADAQKEMAKAASDYELARRKIMHDLKKLCPELKVGDGYQGQMATTDPQRAQLHTALLASVPQRLADAATRLDQQEIDLLRELTVGALDSEQATGFLNRIPTVGELVPKARLTELEA